MNKIVWAVVAASIAGSSFVVAQPPLVVRVPPQFLRAPDKLPEKPVQSAVLSLLSAIEAEDYANFLRVGDDEFKTDLAKEKFERMVNIAAERLAKGYDVVYFGELKKPPYTLHLWKLVIFDGRRELLGEISIRDDKVVGFFIH